MVRCDPGCGAEDRVLWEHPVVEVALTPDKGWESKDFLEEVISQLKPEAWWGLAGQNIWAEEVHTKTRREERAWLMITTENLYSYGYVSVRLEAVKNEAVELA